MDDTQPDADRLVAGSAVMAAVLSLIALAAAALGPIAAIPAIAGMVASLRARVQLRGSPYRGYTISLVAFMVSVGVLAWALVPLIMPIVASVIFLTFRCEAEGDDAVASSRLRLAQRPEPGTHAGSLASSRLRLAQRPGTGTRTGRVASSRLRLAERPVLSECGGQRLREISSSSAMP